jgi:hypothetical protein
MGFELFFCWIRYVASGVQRIACAGAVSDVEGADFRWSLWKQLVSYCSEDCQ